MIEEKYKYAGFWIRVGASLIDSLLLVLIIMPSIVWFYGGENVFIDYFDVMYLGYFDIFMSYVFPFIVTMIFWIYASATPGKLILHMKIVDATTGENLSVLQSIGRYLAYLPSILLFMLGIIWVAFDSRKQGLHDKLAKTVVLVRTKTTKDVSFDKKSQ